jgi:hypothetical protein
MRAVDKLQPGTQWLRGALRDSLEERWGATSLAGREISLYKAAAALDPRHHCHVLLYPSKEATEELKGVTLTVLQEMVPSMLKALRGETVGTEKAREEKGEDAGQQGQQGGAGASAGGGAAAGGRTTVVIDSDDDDDDDDFDAEYYRKPAAAPSGDGEEAAPAEVLSEEVARTLLAAELEIYWGKIFSKDFKIKRKASVAKWWASEAQGGDDKMGKMRHLALCALRLMSIPATSACVERLFSAAGQHVTDLRNRLMPERLQQLMFVGQNWRPELLRLSEREKEALRNKPALRSEARKVGGANVKRVRDEVLGAERRDEQSKKARQGQEGEEEEEVEVLGSRSTKQQSTMDNWVRKR